MEQLDLDRPATHHRERVAVAESAKPAPADKGPPEKPPAEVAVWLTIGQRMAAIRRESFGIGKQDIQMQNADRTKSWTIKGHTIEAVLSEMRPLLDKHGVDLTPSLVERAYTGNRCDVIVDFVFECLDYPEVTGVGLACELQRTVRWAGAGTDNGDKAFAKAGTNALKEMLKKVFLITDRDDAKEEEEKVEHQTEEGASRAKLEKASAERRAAIGSWAKSFKSALENAKDVREIDRLKLDNRDQLGSEDLPEVTRTFFNELIAERKAELE